MLNIVVIISCTKDEPLPAFFNNDLYNINVFDITSTTAACSLVFEINRPEGITNKGMCWSTSHNPTIRDFSTSDGPGGYLWTSYLEDLAENTTYYIRAYAYTNGELIYNEETSFSTAKSSGVFKGEIQKIQAGSMYMGSDNGANDELPIHNVTVSNFKMSKYEITTKQFVDFLNDVKVNSDGKKEGVNYISMINSSDIKFIHDEDTAGEFEAEEGKENYAARNITWAGAKAFCDFHGARLPTEAEWEFAARGGNSSNGYKYAGSNNLNDVAAHGHLTLVGTANPNELGLYDMSGNVAEWVNDWYDDEYYGNSPGFNPQGPSNGTTRVTRGGSVGNFSANTVSARRPKLPDTDENESTGFRIAFDL